MTTSLARLIVSVSDLEPSIAFYGDILGLGLTRRAKGFAWLATADGAELMLHERPSAPSDTAVAIGFFVEDAPDAVARWEALGGVIIDPPAAQPWGEVMAVVRDPDGHIVCVSTPAVRRPGGGNAVG